MLALLKTVSVRVSIIVFSALGYWSGSHFVIFVGKSIVKCDVSDTTMSREGV